MAPLHCPSCAAVGKPSIPARPCEHIESPPGTFPVTSRLGICRGRSGWFVAAQAEIFQYEPYGWNNGKVELALYSKRRGEYAPIIITAPDREAMLSFLAAALFAVAEVKP